MNQENSRDKLIEAIGAKDITKDYFEEEIDITTLKYVLYVRKSNDREDKQETSLEDQKANCLNYADANQLNIVDIIEEQASAKLPDTRKKFRGLIESIEKGEYDALIAWHPDRLARNMKEAGEIIDLLDKGIILDLKFPTFAFSNDSTGKMSLGMHFVMSKQYSDNLSTNVKRGIEKAIERGEYPGQAPHGYKKNRNKEIVPDGDNFNLIKEAFDMRVKGARLQDVCDFLNDSNYTKYKSKENPKASYKFTTQKASPMFKNTIYAGVLEWGDSAIDLVKNYDFEPLLTVDEFLVVNNDMKASKGSTEAKFLNGMVTCGHCGKNMSPYYRPKKNAKGKVKYLYINCNNKLCERHNKNVKARVFIKYASEFIYKHQFKKKKNYEHVLSELKKDGETRLRRLKDKKRLLSVKINKTVRNYENTLRTLSNNRNEKIRVDLEEAVEREKNYLKKFRKELDETKDKIDHCQTYELNFKEFLELWEIMAYRIHNLQDPPTQSKLIKKIFLNFTIINGEVASHSLNEPFKTWVNKGLYKVVDLVGFEPTTNRL